MEADTHPDAAVDSLPLSTTAAASAAKASSGAHKAAVAATAKPTQAKPAAAKSAPSATGPKAVKPPPGKVNYVLMLIIILTSSFLLHGISKLSDLIRGRTTESPKYVFLSQCPILSLTF